MSMFLGWLERLIDQWGDRLNARAHARQQAAAAEEARLARARDRWI